MTEEKLIAIAREKMELFINQNRFRKDAEMIKELATNYPEIWIKFIGLIWQEGYKDCEQDLHSFLTKQRE